MGSGFVAATFSGLKAISESVPAKDKSKGISDPGIVGFNHIQNTKSKIMNNTVFHPASSRGLADHGWLKSRHTFSFANYYNPERMNFGVLCVLNDDIVSAGEGFGTHPHDNMEIISIPLSGDLHHQDSIGNKAIIRQGDIQVMSAGTGVRHSEYNASKENEVRFLQIWVIPSEANVPPRYDQISMKDIVKMNQLNQILSPHPDDAGVWIHQNAWFHLGQYDQPGIVEYSFKSKSNGVYIFNLEGEIKVGDQMLSSRDGYGVWDIDDVKIEAISPSRFLVMEVPMSV